jgi:serine/threonine-protein kinase
VAAPQAEPTTSNDGGGGDRGNGHTGRKDRDHWSLLERALAFLTALLTLATAGLGLLAASAASERDDAQDEAAQLSNDLEVRTGDLEAAQAQITELEQQLDDATSTTITTDDPSGGSGDQEPPPGETPLPELDPVVDDNWDPKRDLDVDGTLHPLGIQSKALGYCGSGLYIEQQVEYSIGRQYSQLEAMAGLSEESLPGLPVKLEIFGDGRSLWSETLVVGSPKPVDLDVSGVLRLRVVATKDFDDPGGGCNYVYAALGAPTLRP